MNDLIEHHVALDDLREIEDRYHRAVSLVIGVGLAVIMVIVQSCGLRGLDVFDGFIIGELVLGAGLVALHLIIRRKMNKIDRSYAIRHWSVVGRKPAKPLKRRILK